MIEIPPSLFNEILVQLKLEKKIPQSQDIETMRLVSDFWFDANVKTAL
jgi:hypothetical protein